MDLDWSRLLVSPHIRPHPFPDFIWWTISVSAVVHTLLFLLGHHVGRLFPSYQPLSPNEKRTWNNRLASNFHAIIVTPVTVWVLLTGWESIVRDPVSFRTNVADMSFGFSLGYFVYDLVAMLWFYPKLGGHDAILHHVIGVLCWGTVLAYQRMTFFILVFAATEISTPCVNQRWYLSKAKMTDSRWYLANGVAMLVLFAVIRVPMSPLASWAMYKSWGDVAQLPLVIPGIAILALIGGTVLNGTWTFLLFRGLIKHLKRHADGPKKGV